MKAREKQILSKVINEEGVAIQELLKSFNISKRTLYYDVESINFHIRQCGQVKNIDGYFVYVGKFHSLQEILESKELRFETIQDRVNYVLLKILSGDKVTIEKLAIEMGLSKNSIVKVFEEIKKNLLGLGLHLEVKPRYHVIGNEYKIRNLFILLMQEDNNLLNYVDANVLLFDQTYQLYLTDYSLASLARFISFVRYRIKMNCTIGMPVFSEEVQQFSYYQGISLLLPEGNEAEQVYLAGFIATGSSLKYSGNRSSIDIFVEKLIYQFEVRTAIPLVRKEEFKRNLTRHLLSSYYRIKFHFPVSNPILENIKLEYSFLYRIIKSIIERMVDFDDFKGIREEEVGFITAYFGSYLRNINGVYKNKVLLVCPNGLMISKTLEVQLYQSIPMIEVDIVSLKELNNYQKDYDYIISTVHIEKYENVIIVNPLLTRLDIETIINTLGNVSTSFVNFDVEHIIDIVKQHAKIIDEVGLKKELLKVSQHIIKKENTQPMLKDLINQNRIQKIHKVKDWKEAITYASQPLLKDQSIEKSYIQSMIDAIEEHGPYVVLADRFALPHASMNSGVNQLSMSLLVVEEEVDMLGKPVNVFMILATTDTTSHMRALASLSELLYESENLEIFIKGNEKEILKLIQEQESEEI